MKIKQKASFIGLAFFLSFVGSSLITADTYAVTKQQFADILCGDFQGPTPNGGTVADECKQDANDGTLSNRWYNKVIKFADWKNKSAAQLYQHVGKTPPSQNPPGTPPSSTSGSCGGVDTAILPSCPDNGATIQDNAVWSIMLLVINILSAGIGLVAVGGIIYASVLYTSAQNNSSQVTKAKETIFNVILGLVMFALMWSFLQFLIPGGIFS